MFDMWKIHEIFKKKKAVQWRKKLWENAMRREMGWGPISQGFKCSPKHASDKIICWSLELQKLALSPGHKSSLAGFVWWIYMSCMSQVLLAIWVELSLQAETNECLVWASGMMLIHSDLQRADGFSRWNGSVVGKSRN